MKRAFAIGLFLVLAACANTRDPNPISMKEAGDSQLSCVNIMTEYQANTRTASEKIAKNNSDDGKDVLLGVLIWPGLADFKNADGIEGNALLDRNIYLLALAKEKQCDVSEFAVQPQRYK